MRNNNICNNILTIPRETHTTNFATMTTVILITTNLTSHSCTRRCSRQR